MNKTYRILVINPGSTSTKLSMFENETCLFTEDVFHDSSVLKRFPTINDQLNYRMEVVDKFLKDGNIDLAGVDAIVAEGFEAGGHNGREETTTMCLIPAVRKATSLPLLAAGGIGNGQAMLAALALGADGVQIGTRFALTKESSAHENFKKLCLNLKEGDTKLLLKKLSPTRLVKGDFATAVEEAEARGASVEELRELLGKGRAKKGIFEGDLKEGELEIGQVASLFWEELSVEEVMKELIRDFKLSLENVKTQLCS